MVMNFATATIVKNQAKVADVNPLLALAVCDFAGWQEDFFDYKIGYNLALSPVEFSEKNDVSVDTEIVLQCSAIGVMQVMGFHARQLGYSGSLIKLIDPSIGTKYGCLRLKAVVDSVGEKEANSMPMDKLMEIYNGQEL